ncbi:MAG: hypothetical protein GY715_03345 [Planctomycetes bacterium]|nr:hypothetical protein [Planctomycetota bacterium]
MSDSRSSVLRTIAQILVTALAYFVTGRLSLLLTIPPGYTAPVWPAAGVAVGCLLLFGYRAWPGAVLGSIAANISNFDDGTASAFVRAFGIATGIGIGVGLQALFGTWLIRRFVDLDRPVDRLRDILRCQALGGPIGCLVSSSIGVTVLAVSGIMPWESFLSNWSTWWIGDSTGVLIVVPLAIAMLMESGRAAWHRRMTVAAPLLLTFVVIAAAFVYVRDTEWQSLRNTFDQRVTVLHGALDRELDEHVHDLGAIADFFAASNEVTREEFGVFVQRELERHPSIRALEWVPRVPGERRAEFEAAARHDGLDGFRFTQRREQGVMERADTRVEHFPVLYVEPAAGNEAALGFDLASDECRLDAIIRARDTGRSVATPRIALVQGSDELNGILVFRPMYDGPGKPATVAERRDRLAGFALGVFVVDHLLSAAWMGLPDHDAHLKLVDRTDAEPALLLDTRTAAAESVASFTSTRAVSVGGRRWRAVFTPTEDFLTRHGGWGAWAVIIGGLVFSALLGAMLLVVSGREAIVTRLVHDRTGQLRDANEQLEQKHREMAAFTYSVSHDLKSPLVTIEGFAGHLVKDLQGNRHDRLNAFTERILGGTRRMRRNIDDLLELSRVGHAATETHRVDTKTLAWSLVRDHETQIVEAGATIVVARQMPEVIADGHRLHQALQNLLVNALKYGRPEHGEFRITIDGEVVDGEARLYVTDNGPGIPEGYQEKMFDLFQRLQTGGEGSGVGLAIVRRVAEMHGGRAWVESTPGAGARFGIALPAAETPAPIMRAA